MKPKTVINIDLKIENHITTKRLPAGEKPAGKGAIREAYEILYNAGLNIPYRTFCHHIQKIKADAKIQEWRKDNPQEKNSTSQPVSEHRNDLNPELSVETDFHQFLAGFSKFVEDFQKSHRS